MRNPVAIKFGVGGEEEEDRKSVLKSPGHTMTVHVVCNLLLLYNMIVKEVSVVALAYLPAPRVDYILSTVSLPSNCQINGGVFSHE